jgi:hypothetical protein
LEVVLGGGRVVDGKVGHREAWLVPGSRSTTPGTPRSSSSSSKRWTTSGVADWSFSANAD